MQDQGIPRPPMPPVRAETAHLLLHWHEMGRCQGAGMGPVPTGWSELQAWQAATGHPLQPWEARLLIGLSRAYTEELAAGADPMRPAPWGHVSSEHRRAVAQAMERELSAMVRADQARQVRQPHRGVPQ